MATKHKDIFMYDFKSYFVNNFVHRSDSFSKVYAGYPCWLHDGRGLPCLTKIDLFCTQKNCVLTVLCQRRSYVSVGLMSV